MSLNPARIRPRPLALDLGRARPDFLRRATSDLPLIEDSYGEDAPSPWLMNSPFSPNLPQTPGVGPMTPYPPMSASGATRIQMPPLLDRLTPQERQIMQTRPHLLQAYEEVRRGLTAETDAENLNLLRGVLRKAVNRRDVISRADQERRWRELGEKKTSWLPVSYFALSLTGRFMFSMGAVLFEKELFPGQPNIPGDVEMLLATRDVGMPDDIPAGDGPLHGPSGGLQADLNRIPGALITITGFLMAVVALGLFYRQARKKNPKRARVLGSLHLISITLIVAHRFVGTIAAHNWGSRAKLGVDATGWVGAALYAYTVPNSLCAAETALGHTPYLGPPERRTEFALAFGAMGALLLGVWGTLVGKRGTDPYLREFFYIMGSTLVTVGAGLALTNYKSTVNDIERGRAIQEEAEAVDQALPDTGGPRRASAGSDGAGNVLPVMTLGALRRGSAAYLGGPRRGSAAPPRPALSRNVGAQANFPGQLHVPPPPARRHSTPPFDFGAGSGDIALAELAGGPLDSRPNTFSTAAAEGDYFSHGPRARA